MLPSCLSVPSSFSFRHPPASHVFPGISEVPGLPSPLRHICMCIYYQLVSAGVDHLCF